MAKRVKNPNKIKLERPHFLSFEFLYLDSKNQKLKMKNEFQKSKIKNEFLKSKLKIKISIFKMLLSIIPSFL